MKPLLFEWAAACWHLGCTMFAPDLAHRVDPLLIGLNERRSMGDEA